MAVAHRPPRVRSTFGARALHGRRACAHRTASDRDIGNRNGKKADRNCYLLLTNVKQSFLN